MECGAFLSQVARRASMNWTCVQAVLVVFSIMADRNVFSKIE